MNRSLVLLLCVFTQTLYSQHQTMQTERLHKNLAALEITNVIVDYTIPDHTVSQTVVDGGLYHFFHLPGTGKMQEPGKPALPVFTELIAMPFNAAATLVSSSESFTDYHGYVIHPSLQPATDHIGDPEPLFEIDQDLYQTDAFFPENIIEIVDTLMIRGMKVAVVQVRPVQFNPVQGVVRIHQGLTLDMRFDGAGISFEPFALLNSAKYNAWLSNILLNGALLPAGIESSLPASDAEYIIVTIDAFRSAADSIARWRHQMGLKTEIVSQPSWTVQQVTSAVHSRYHSYIPRPDYLLILGDHDHVPGQLIPVDNTNFATDLYYVCMDGSADHYPDMAKGRISIANASQAMMVVNKIINYERNPVNDSLFYQHALHCAQFQDDDTSGYATRRFTHTSEELREYIMSKGYTVDRVYHTYSYINPTNYNNTIYSNGEPLPPDLLRANGFLWNGDYTMISQAINSGRFYVLHRDHGGVTGWGHPTYTTTSMNALANGNKLPVVFSINCQTGNFLQPECFSEKFLRLSTGGAVGVFGASYVSYSGYNDAITVGAFDAIWNDPGIVPLFGSGGVANPVITPHPPILPMGMVLNHAMLRMVQTWNGSTSANTRQYRMFHYFGDPAMKMFTAPPAMLTAIVPDTIVVGTTHMNISGCNTPDALVTLVYKDTLASRGVIASGNITLNFYPLYDTAYTATVTISKHNFRPFLKEVVIVGQAPAAHNNPCDALPIPVNRYCDPLPSGFAGADVSPVPNPACASANHGDVWFRFVAPASGMAEVEAGDGIQNVGVAAYSSACIAPVFLACETSAGTAGRVTLSLNALTGGDTILVRVWKNNQAASHLFSICVREPDTFVYAQLPYYTGFETGIDQYWELVSSNAAGRIRIDSICDARYGNKSLLMDQSINGTFAQNEARLRVDLRGKEKVKLKFWWREYGDETHVEDGVFFSDDGGESFVKVIELQGAFEAWTQYVVDVDRLAALNGLKLTESFIIKFQQYDNWGMICSNPTGGDGFAFDDIYVYVDTTYNTWANLPYQTGFEDGFDQYWDIKSTEPQGRIVVTGAYGPPAEGSYSLMMDISSTNIYNLNAADLRLNVNNLNNLILSLKWKSFNDEIHVEDGIYLSDDGGNSFTRVVWLNDTNTYWSEKNLNLAAIAQAHNLSPGANTVLRLVQYDNWSVTSDGFGFDDIRLYYAVEPVIDLNPIAMYVSADTGTTATRSFSIINQGTDLLRIDSVIVPDGFAISFAGPVQIMPGDTLTPTLTFFPDSVKNYTGNIYVFHNAVRGLDSLRLNGLGMHRELQPDISAIIFDTLEILNRDTITFNLTNIGNGAVTTNSITTPAGFLVLTPQSQSFSVGQSRPVRVRFFPTAPGLYSGMLTISTNANQLVLPISGYAYNPLTIENPEEEHIFKISPNPCSNHLNIQSSLLHGYEILLSDMAGRTMVHQKGTGHTTLDMKTLSAGLYILELIPENKQNPLRMKILKE